jgi:hypothetical protein
MREQKINLFAYILAFIPVHILQAFICMWDGGLREFVILERDLGKDFLDKGQTAFEHAEQIWNREKISVLKD